MAKRKRLAFSPLVRSIVRGGVRSGRSTDDIRDDVRNSFPNMTDAEIDREINAERPMQRAIESVMQEDKRSNVDLARRLKCPAGTKRVRVNLTIEWPAGAGGGTNRFNHSVEIDARGRLSELLNAAIRGVIAEAVKNSYSPPGITSASVAGSARYRIERMDCV